METSDLYTLLALVGAYLVYKTFFGPRKAPAAAVRAKLEAGAVALDVRSPGEFRQGTYPRAKNAPLDTLPGSVDAYDRAKPLVVFCASGARSARAAKLLAKAGFKDVTNAGGLSYMPRA